MYEKIDGICDDIGCSRNDWIKDTLNEKLREETNENSQDQEVIKNTKLEPKSTLTEIKVEDVPEPKPTIEEIPEPKTIIKEVPQDNSQKPPVTYTRYDGKLRPFAKRYNI